MNEDEEIIFPDEESTEELQTDSETIYVSQNVSNENVSTDVTCFTTSTQIETTTILQTNFLQQRVNDLDYIAFPLYFICIIFICFLVAFIFCRRR